MYLNNFERPWKRSLNGMNFIFNRQHVTVNFNSIYQLLSIFTRVRGKRWQTDKIHFHCVRIHIYLHFPWPNNWCRFLRFSNWLYNNLLASRFHICLNSIFLYCLTFLLVLWLEQLFSLSSPLILGQTYRSK